MNAALTLPRGLRHPSWYIPLLLPILPLLGVRAAWDTNPVQFLLGAGAMVLLGLLYSVGLGAWVDRLPRLIRKEIEQLRPAWLLGLFGAECGLLFREQNDLDAVLILPPLLFALLAALSFGIEFQQRTMPSLLCAPVDRVHLWRIKMAVLAGGLLAQVLVFALSASIAQATVSSSLGNAAGNVAILTGFALAFAFAAWATVPLWTLLTRNLLAGLVFSLAVPPLTFFLIGSLAQWITSPFGFASDLDGIVVGTLTVTYLLASPWLTWRRWLTLEAPDQAEREISGLFIGQRQTTATQAVRKGSWWGSLIGKETRLQTVTLVALGVAVLLTLIKPYLPHTLVTQELASLLIGLFAVVSILLAGATSIAEERRLGTLDGQVLQPVSRTLQWFLKLLLALAITAVAIGLLIGLVPPQHRSFESYIQLGGVIALFVFSFLASSATPNSLRALILGLAFTGAMLAVCYAIVAMVVALEDSTEFARQAMQDPEPWLARARAMSESDVAALADRLVPRSLPTLFLVVFIAAATPLVLALAFAHRNFTHPSAASRRLQVQFLVCVLTTLVLGGSAAAGARWLNRQSILESILIQARNQVEFEALLSPAELRLWRAQTPLRLDTLPHTITFRRRVPSGGIAPKGPPTPPHLEPMPRVSPDGRLMLGWRTETHPLPLDPMTRALIIRDADIPEDVREALRLEAVGAGDTNVPATPGRPPGPWPTPTQPSGYRMSPDLMRRYGLTPTENAAAIADPATDGTPPRVDGQAPPAGNPATPNQMSPELMQRYGLVPRSPAAPTTSSPSPAPATSTPPAP